jgi:hypothetical protein
MLQYAEPDRVRRGPASRDPVGIFANGRTTLEIFCFRQRGRYETDPKFSKFFRKISKDQTHFLAGAPAHGQSRFG